MGKDALVDLELVLLTRSEAERVVRGRRGHDRQLDRPWADEYPLEGDIRACVAYLAQLAAAPGGRRLGGVGVSAPPPAQADPFGYYQIVVSGEAAGGIGFHGPPRRGGVEIGYGVVPAVRGQGVATEALRRMLTLAGELNGVRMVRGRTTEDNVASQRVMLNAGMELVRRDTDFWHYQVTVG